MAANPQPPPPPPRRVATLDQTALSVIRSVSTAPLAGSDTPRLPGAGIGVRVALEDGRELSAVSRGDALDLYFHLPRVGTMVFAVPSRAALRVALWVVFRWWMLSGWFGLRWRLYTWAARRLARSRKPVS